MRKWFKKNDDEIELISMESISWFEQDAFGYFFPVKRSECDRVYDKTEYFRYKGRKCKYFEEQNGKIRLVAVFDYEEALKLGFSRCSYDEYEKWVDVSEGEFYEEIVEY